MCYSLRHLPPESKFSSELSLEALSQTVPLEIIDAVLGRLGVQEQRERKFRMRMIVLVCIAMHLYSRLSLGQVLQRLAQGLRYLWPDPDYALPGESAITYRRYQLGVEPMEVLFRQVCRPMATPQTPGAFRFGLRVMAVDGTIEDVPDTPANAAAFGRHQTDRGPSAFPQVEGVYLVECGTHAIVDACFWPCLTSERIGGMRLLRSVGEAMLLMWDRGFHSYEMLHQTRLRGAQVLSRLPAGVQPKVVAALPDGSVYAYLYPDDPRRRKRGEHLLVRIVTYTLTDPEREGYQERHRLVTTLLDWRLAPAQEVVLAYHERWEEEIVIDEVDTHQRLAGRPLRSLKPVGVLQELYGLLIAHYAIRALMHEAALQAGTDPDRLSFVHALHVLQMAVPEFQMTAPEHLPALLARLLRDLARKRLPARRPRVNPRVVKRKMSTFPLKRAEQTGPYHLLRPFSEVIQLI